ncbi:hypothetical protein M758_3G055600 [Ceratodon purpureus]|uniref:NB-ARC domain-containing protein n=1 Tax=Ceratodon purpureus TaxID=3225 RepID=A0A8T0H405_CERPU|nr:hypothetical protein KC19_8G163700 [Ceratodon purpureus]KAG0621875.1 hypothetical protein M758_3G054900 [Ceratodon purpureus]KAG0621882.1 hypothetical protein M758_3G055600 [Ceratodon purpureus]
MTTSCRHQDTYTTFGRDHDIVVEQTIQKLLLDSKASKNDVECIGIWGLGGSRKTLTATHVFNKEKIQAYFIGGCYWLTVGNSKTSVPKLLCEMRQKMVSSLPTHSKDEDIKNDLFRNLKGWERMLLVLDDVWKIQTLEILEVMPKGVQCKIVITTRDEGVLNKKHATKLKMPILSPLKSWKLFCHHACCGDVNMPLDLKEVDKQITSECGRLLLALKVIGGYLTGSIEPSYWERTLDKLRNASMVSPNHYEQLYSKLELSVDELQKVHPQLKY